MVRPIVGALALLAILLAAAPAQAAQEDPWWGQDKALHFGVSAGLGAGGYGLSSLVLEPRWQRATAGAGFSLSLGIGKEVYDAAYGGDPSWKDLTWDVIGTAVGVGVALLIDVAIGTRGSSGASDTQGALTHSLRWCW